MALVHAGGPADVDDDVGDEVLGVGDVLGAVEDVGESDAVGLNGGIDVSTDEPDGEPDPAGPSLAVVHPHAVIATARTATTTRRAETAGPDGIS